MAAATKRTKFYSLFDKSTPHYKDRWIVFPWEAIEVIKGDNESEGPTDAVIRLLEFIGEDVHREGLKETPARVLKSFKEIYGGYDVDPATHMKTFVEGACDEMVLLKDIEFYSTCEHHMQPFFGKAHIAYVPDNRVIGVSKLARVLDVYARRLQIQEKLTDQVAGALLRGLQPKGVAVVLEARHFCMVCRGVGKQNSIMTTSCLQGVFRRDAAARAEFFQLIK